MGGLKSLGTLVRNHYVHWLDLHTNIISFFRDLIGKKCITVNALIFYLSVGKRVYFFSAAAPGKLYSISSA